MFDSLYLEQAGAENYVKLYKGETDVAQDPAYKTAAGEARPAQDPT